MLIHVRFAETQADQTAIYRLRYQIYIEELRRKEPADHDRRLMPDPPGRKSRLLLTEHDGAVIGTLRLDWGGDGQFSAEDRVIYRLDELERIVRPEQIAIFSRFMTALDYRGGDAPGLLIDAMIRFVLAHQIRVLLCDCRPPLINTYLRLGFRVFGDLVNEASVGVLVPLILLIDDHDHMASVGSRIHPFVSLVAADTALRDRLLALLPAEPKAATLESPQDAPHWTRMLEVLTAVSPERFPIFQGLSVADVARLTSMSNVIVCGAGDLIIRQGTIDSMVCVVLQGAVDVVRDGRVIQRRHAGSVLGEIGFLVNAPRTADIVAACDSRLICLRQSTMAALIATEPGVAAPLLFNLARILALRLAAPDAAPHSATSP